MALYQGQVGPQVQSDGALPVVRVSKDASQVVQDGHGRYQEAVYRGNCFLACTQAAITFSVGISTTTAVGLIVSNPVGSGKNLVLLQAEFANTGVIVGTAAISIMTAQTTAVTHTTALTIQNALVGSTNVGVAKADSGSGLPVAPVAAKALISVLSTNTAVIGGNAIVDLGGSLVIAPGAAAAILATAAVTGFASMMWEEIPI